MEAKFSAPLLSRIKSWQLVCLGITGWVTLYSVAIIYWGANSFVIGNAQGGCFATAMTLSGLEVRRFGKRSSLSIDPLQWVGGITTEQLNQTLAQNLKMQQIRVETPHSMEAEMGFGVRAIKAGRTLVFETGRWKEPVINLLHAQTTEENRNRIRADLAIIVGAGTPDEDTKRFVQDHKLKLLVGKELKDMFPHEVLSVSNMETSPGESADESQNSPPGQAA